MHNDIFRKFRLRLSFEETSRNNVKFRRDSHRITGVAMNHFTTAADWISTRVRMRIVGDRLHASEHER